MAPRRSPRKHPVPGVRIVSGPTVEAKTNTASKERKRPVASKTALSQAIVSSFGKLKNAGVKKSKASEKSVHRGKAQTKESPAKSMARDVATTRAVPTRARSPAKGSSSTNESVKSGATAEVSDRKPRGQPRKATSVPITAPRVGQKQSPSRIASRASTPPTSMPAPTDGHEFTDSPTKKSPTKAGSKTRAASVEGVRGSIETRGIRERRSRSLSPKKELSASKAARGRSPVKRISRDVSHGPRSRSSATRSHTPRATGSDLTVAKTRSPSRRTTDSLPTATSVESFLERFSEDDGYGEMIRTIEAEAYKASKRGVKPDSERFKGRVTVQDRMAATRRGVQRATSESRLNNRAAAKDDTHVAEGYNTRLQKNGQGHRSASPTEQRSVSLARSRAASPPKRRVASPAKKRAISPHETRASSPEKTASSTSCDPQTLKNGSPSSGAKRKLSRAQSPASESTTLGRGRPSAPGRGPVHSVTNPEYIPGTKKKNPFFETMPAPEIWHENMPPYFTAGETPYMEAAISRQINAELAQEIEAEPKPTPSLLSRATSTFRTSINAMSQSVFGTSFVSSTTVEPIRYPPKWELPLPPKAAVDSILKELQRREVSRTKAGTNKNDDRPVKRARRKSSYQMSGALQ